MQIADNIIRERIKNVYFIWGRGKTTIANELKRRYGCSIYDVDEYKNHHWKKADPLYQPYMCRDYVKEYGVSDFWELPPEVIRDREDHFLHEFTPMAVIDLVLLAPKHDIILCEGDIDIETIIHVASHIVYLSNRGTKFDWFNRPGHEHSIDSIKNRIDITEEEKEEIIAQARNMLNYSEVKLPDWVINHGIKNIVWNDEITIDQTASEVAQYFGFLRT